MKIFSQTSVKVTVLEMLLNNTDFDLMSYSYKKREMQFKSDFSVVIETLNDLIFGCLYIKLLKYNKIIGSIGMKHKVAAASIRLGSLDFEKSIEEEYDVYKISDVESADYYGKQFQSLGKIRLRLDFETLNQSLRDGKDDGVVSRVFNGLLNADLTHSFEAINNISSFLSRGSPFCNIKSIIGMIIVDGILIKKLSSEHCDRSEAEKCTIKKCMCGYGPISSALAEQALKCTYYSIGAYLDSKMWQMVIKPRFKIKDVSDKKLRGALERIGISEDKFIKYFEGDLKKIGFIVFIDENKLVISLRGTLSHNDVINDLNAEYTPFLQGYAHSGILKLANNFINSELQHIKEVLEFNNIKDLLITGHSLGGGVATLLHMLISNKNLVPGCSLSTYTFASPPTVSSDFLGEKVENLITYNYGNDFVPRLSLGALLDFKYLCLSMSNIHSVFSDNDPSLRKIVEIRKHLYESNLYPKLYQPGIIYHIKSENDGQEKKYGFRMVPADFFSSLVYFKDFPNDHMLKGHINAFNYCINNENCTSKQ